MICDSCKYWKPTYAPYVVHGNKLSMTCQKDKSYERGGCKDWEKREEDIQEKKPLLPDVRPTMDDANKALASGLKEYAKIMEAAGDGADEHI